MVESPRLVSIFSYKYFSIKCLRRVGSPLAHRLEGALAQRALAPQKFGLVEGVFWVTGISFESLMQDCISSQVASP